MRWIMRQNGLLVMIGAAACLVAASGAAENGGMGTGEWPCYESVVDLIAAGGNEESAFKVGEVAVVDYWDEEYGTVLTITYRITEPGWCLTETHLDVEYDWQDIPQADGGNAIPGQFAYKCEHDCVQGFTYSIEGYAEGEEVAIAAHAVVLYTEEGVLNGWSADAEADLCGPSLPCANLDGREGGMGVASGAMDFSTGLDELDFILREYVGIGSPPANPAGPDHQVSIEYDNDLDESAWGAGEDFPGNNWSMYFWYTIGECGHGYVAADTWGSCEEE
jgi:hypothetical protein